jgi:hypothetical protein
LNPCPQCDPQYKAWKAAFDHWHGVYLTLQAPRETVQIEQRKLKNLRDEIAAIQKRTSNPGTKAAEINVVRGKIAEEEKELAAAQAKIDQLTPELESAELALAKAVRAFNACVDKCEHKDNSASRLDPCLVGTWKLETYTDAGFTVGGSGILLTIEKDGTATIDYNGMKPLERILGPYNFKRWTRGTATGYITTLGGDLFVNAIETSEITNYENDQHGQIHTHKVSRLGPAVPDWYHEYRSYQCDETTFTHSNPIQKFVYKRQLTTQSK